MSGKLLGQIYGLKLAPAKREILLAMAENTCDDDGGHCNPGVPLIAWKTDYSERQVQRIQQALIADKLLVIVAAPVRKPIEYRIDTSAGTPKPAFVPRDQRRKGDKMSQTQGDILSTDELRVTSHGNEKNGDGDKMTPLLVIEGDKLSENDDLRVTSYGENEVEGDIAWGKTTSISTSLPKKTITPVNGFKGERKDAQARPRFHTALYAGQDCYADGQFISPENDFHDFLVACNAIFDAWLGALKTLKRAPMVSDEKLWEQHREAAVSLAKFRANPADVTAFVVAQYKAKDPFWRNLTAPMKLSAVANGLAGWKANPVEESAPSNGAHSPRAAPPPALPKTASTNEAPPTLRR